MPDRVKEKLVELLYTAEELAGKRCDSYPNCDNCPADNKRIDCMDWLKADCLLSLGVTVQEWISQAELPWMGEEIAKLCIRYMEEYADFHGYASSKKVKAHIVRLLELEKDGRIAIMPLPPKGERNGNQT